MGDIMKHTADNLLDILKNEKAEHNDGIVYLISNMDKLKYLSLGNKPSERREAIIKHVLSIYPRINKGDMDSILTKNLVIRNSFFDHLSLIPTLLTFFGLFYMFYTTHTEYNYNPSENAFLNCFSIFF